MIPGPGAHGARGIEPERVQEILLADGWHYVEPETFSLNEFTFEGQRSSAADEPGFDCIERWCHDSLGRGYTGTLSGPRSSILAVRYDEECQ